MNGNVASMAPLNLPPEADADAIPEPAQWVRRAREGDEVAFALLVRRHERMVLRTALRLLGAMDRAQDASQECFLRLHRHLGRIDESLELGPWLYRVVVNVSRDMNRRWRWPRIVGLDHVAGATLVDHRSQALHTDVERSDQLRLIQAALLTLPLKEREAIVLRDLEGLTTAEVAAVLGSSEGTVRSQICTGRLKIRAFVEAQGAKR